MLFKELSAVARHTPLTLAISPQEGGRLKVIFTPLPTGKAKDYDGLCKQFSATGTPEELDTEFMEALNKYSTKVNEVRAEIGLPLAELDKVREAADKKTAKLKKKAEEEEAEKKRKEEASAKRAETLAAKKAEKERQDKERADKRAAKKAAKGKPASPEAEAAELTLPGAAKATAPADETPGARSESVRPDLPGKADCIADYRRMKLKHGDKLTRLMFTKKSETGRRYERLWKNWADFLKEATAQGELPLDTPAAAAKTEPAVETATKTEEKAPEPKPSIVVLDRDTKETLGTLQEDPLEGELIKLAGRGETLQVDRVTPGVCATVHAVLEEAYLILDDVGNALGHTSEIYKAGDQVTELTKDGDFRVAEILTHDRAYKVRDAKPKFQVFTEDDELIVEYKSAPVVGERLTIPERAHPYKVLAIDGQRVTARRVLPTKNRLIDHATSEALGHTEEVYEVADQVAELSPKDYRVVKVELDAYHVKLSKPRVAGPAAVLVASPE